MLYLEKSRKLEYIKEKIYFRQDSHIKKILKKR